jgi:C1A family cysteine protease
MSVSQAVRYVTNLGGILLRKKYPFGDFTKYNGKLGASWGRNGTPKEVTEEAKKHQVKTGSLITTIEGARDAIANGYALTVGSNVGFESKRDKNGISEEKGSWGHCMCWGGCDDSREIYDETLFLIINSWGNWNSGPKRLYQPDGSFWIRERTARKMLSQNQAFALSNVDGFPLRDIKWTMDEVFS